MERGFSAQAEVSVETMDFLSTPAIAAMVARWTAERPLDMALIAHGVLSPQQPCQGDGNSSCWWRGPSPTFFINGIDF